MSPGWKNLFINIAASVLVIIAVKFISKFKSPKKVVKLNMKENEKIAVDNQNESFIKDLHPKVKDKVRKLLNDWYNAGYLIRITSGFRSIPEQNKLYYKGRTRDSLARGEKIVTNAIGGKSFHNFGMAIDTIAIVNGKATYNFDYSKLKPIAIKNGFQWGGDFKTLKDPPHFQYTFGKKENELLAAYNSGKRIGEYVTIV